MAVSPCVSDTEKQELRTLHILNLRIPFKNALSPIAKKRRFDFAASRASEPYISF